MSTLLAIFKLLPTLLEAVKAIEATLPAASAGAQKLQLILDVVGSVEGAGVSSDVISKVVSAIVTFFNKTGVFATTAKAS